MKNSPFKEKRRAKGLILIVLSCLLICPWGVTAETPQADDSAQTIEITADRLITDNDIHTAEFSGNVTAIQGGTQITADRLILHYGGQNRGKGSRAMNNIEKIEAIGRVRMMFDNRVAVSEQAVYTTSDRKLVFTGPSSKISEGRDEITGGEIIFDRNTKKVTIGKGGQDDQVKAIIRSNQRGLN
jgi:lipopolysaccharide export system protein LptA